MERVVLRFELEPRELAMPRARTAATCTSWGSCGLRSFVSPSRVPDAGIMARHCPSGMIFLRCKDGISHNPAESITLADTDLGVRALLEAVRRLDRRVG